jgi:hypothetical protein
MIKYSDWLAFSPPWSYPVLNKSSLLSLDQQHVIQDRLLKIVKYYTTRRATPNEIAKDYSVYYNERISTDMIVSFLSAHPLILTYRPRFEKVTFTSVFEQEKKPVNAIGDQFTQKDSETIKLIKDRVKALVKSFGKDGLPLAQVRYQFFLMFHEKLPVEKEFPLLNLFRKSNEVSCKDGKKGKIFYYNPALLEESSATAVQPALVSAHDQPQGSQQEIAAMELLKRQQSTTNVLPSVENSSPTAFSPSSSTSSSSSSSSSSAVFSSSSSPDTLQYRLEKLLHGAALATGRKIPLTTIPKLYSMIYNERLFLTENEILRCLSSCKVIRIIEENAEKKILYRGTIIDNVNSLENVNEKSEVKEMIRNRYLNILKDAKKDGSNYETLRFRYYGIYGEFPPAVKTLGCSTVMELLGQVPVPLKEAPKSSKIYYYKDFIKTDINNQVTPSLPEEQFDGKKATAASPVVTLPSLHVPTLNIAESPVITVADSNSTVDVINSSSAHSTQQELLPKVVENVSHLSVNQPHLIAASSPVVPSLIDTKKLSKDTPPTIASSISRSSLLSAPSSSSGTLSPSSSISSSGSPSDQKELLQQRLSKVLRGLQFLSNHDGTTSLSSLKAGYLMMFNEKLPLSHTVMIEYLSSCKDILTVNKNGINRYSFAGSVKAKAPADSKDVDANQLKNLVRLRVIDTIKSFGATGGSIETIKWRYYALYDEFVPPIKTMNYRSFFQFIKEGPVTVNNTVTPPLYYHNDFAQAGTVKKEEKQVVVAVSLVSVSSTSNVEKSLPKVENRSVALPSVASQLPLASASPVMASSSSSSSEKTEQDRLLKVLKGFQIKSHLSGLSGIKNAYQSMFHESLSLSDDEIVKYLSSHEHIRQMKVRNEVKFFYGKPFRNNEATEVSNQDELRTLVRSRVEDIIKSFGSKGVKEIPLKWRYYGLYDEFPWNTLSKYKDFLKLTDGLPVKVDKKTFVYYHNDFVPASLLTNEKTVVKESTSPPISLPSDEHIAKQLPEEKELSASISTSSVKAVKEVNFSSTKDHSSFSWNDNSSEEMSLFTSSSFSSFPPASSSSTVAVEQDLSSLLADYFKISSSSSSSVSSFSGAPEIGEMLKSKDELLQVIALAGEKGITFNELKEKYLEIKKNELQEKIIKQLLSFHPDVLVQQDVKLVYKPSTGSSLLKTDTTIREKESSELEGLLRPSNLLEKVSTTSTVSETQSVAPTSTKKESQSSVYSSDKERKMILGRLVSMIKATFKEGADLQSLKQQYYQKYGVNLDLKIVDKHIMNWLLTNRLITVMGENRGGYHVYRFFYRGMSPLNPVSTASESLVQPHVQVPSETSLQSSSVNDPQKDTQQTENRKRNLTKQSSKLNSKSEPAISPASSVDPSSTNIVTRSSSSVDNSPAGTGEAESAVRTEAKVSSFEPFASYDVSPSSSHSFSSSPSPFTSLPFSEHDDMLVQRPSAFHKDIDLAVIYHFMSVKRWEEI